MELEKLRHLPRIEVGESGNIISIKNLKLTELAEVDFSPEASQEEWKFKQTIPSTKEALFYHTCSKIITQNSGKGLQKPVYICGINDNLKDTPGGEYAKLCFVESVVRDGDIITSSDNLVLVPGLGLDLTTGFGFNKICFTRLSEIRNYQARN